METSTILNILRDYAEGEFQLHSNGYAEPGYDDPESNLIATGDWNSRTIRRRIYPDPLPQWLTVAEPNAMETVQDQTMPRIGAILEKLGVELEWEDEWEACSECGKLLRTQPNGYSWTRSYWEDGCGLYCQNCVLDAPEGYLEYLEGNPKVANTLDLDLESQGYRHIDEEYENGLYGGQCDDPSLIAKSLEKLGIGRYIFEIDGAGQFDLSFSVWVHKSEYDKLDPDEIDSKGADPLRAMESALRDASAKMHPLDGPGVRVAKCNSDGTATARLVSKQDFIDGKALD